MTGISQLKAKYLGHAKNPFHQFERLISATSLLPAEIRKRQPDFGELLSDLRLSKNPNAAREILQFRILTELKELDEERWKGDYIEFIYRLRESKYWIEESISDDRESSESENTVFAPQPFHFYDALSAQKLTEIARSRTFGSSQVALTSILKRLNHKLSRDGRSSVIGDVLHNSVLLSALAEIHHEVTDNAYWHALKTSANSNYQKTASQSPFGDVLYLQIHSFSRLNAPNADISKEWPTDVRDYVKSYSTNLGKPNVRFVILSYVDNGPGIIDHVERFYSGDAANPKTISDVIKNQFTTRESPDAGDGLSNVLEAINLAKGLLVITSGSRRFVFDGISNAIDEHSIKNNRGTMITIFIPV